MPKYFMQNNYKMYKFSAIANAKMSAKQKNVSIFT